MGYLRSKGLLTYNEQEVLKYRMGLSAEQKYMSLEEVSKILGFTQERIKQLESKGIDKLGIEASIHTTAEEYVGLIKDALNLYGDKRYGHRI